MESGAGIRPQTLLDILTCYHERLGTESWEFETFLAESSVVASPETGTCPCIQKMRDYYRTIYEQRQPERISDFACESIRFTGEGTTRVGVEVLEQRARTLLDAFDPIKFTVDRIQSQSQIVTSFWTVRMKHVGSFLGIDATERWVDVRGNSLVVFAEGFAVEAEDQFDVDDLLRQLQGLSPRIL
jgi:predicted ester cyclase